MLEPDSSTKHIKNKKNKVEISKRLIYILNYNKL